MVLYVKRIVIPQSVDRELVSELHNLCIELSTVEYIVDYLYIRDRIVALLTKIGLIDQIDVCWKSCEVTYEEDGKPVLTLYEFTKEETWLTKPFY